MRDTVIKLPELSLVLLIGPSSSGKSTFAKRYFKDTEVVSSDACRALVSNDENNLDATSDAFELARYITAKRLKNGLLTVIDATSVQSADRKKWIDLAREYHVIPTAIVFNIKEDICQKRHEQRTDRDFGKHVIQNQVSQLKRGLRNLKHEGFRHIFEFNSPEQVDALESIDRERLYNNKKDVTGPFDIIGDVHGCYTELVELLGILGYQPKQVVMEVEDAPNVPVYFHPEGRKAVFVGDLVDRGPASPQVLQLVMHMVEGGYGYCVPGNHDVKLHRYLLGKNVQLTHGLDLTVEQLSRFPHAFSEKVKVFIDGLISHYVFDNGKLVVAHAGLREEMQGRGSGVVRNFCLYGETTGEIDEFGLPVRYNWAEEYRGKALVVYGHTPVVEAELFNNTIDIDTGCVFGGKLTGMRYPEREIYSVEAKQQYTVPAKPIGYKSTPVLTLQQHSDDMLDVAEVSGKIIVKTQFSGNISINEENTIAALEIMGRFAVNPKWLIYLPPTMSPAETSSLPGYLEYPTEAFSYFKKNGVATVVCEEKHMGSRAIVVIAKDKEAVTARFGIEEPSLQGICYTRTGRNFFTEEEPEKEFIERIAKALTNSGFWDKFATDWVCLDCELMPWNAKAQALLKQQYAAVGAAGSSALPDVIAALGKAAETQDGAATLLLKYEARKEMIADFVTSYRNYCWPVNSIADYKLAPFHIIATEGNAWFSKDHEWHMENIKEICQADPAILLATRYRKVNLENENAVNDATKWWLDMTCNGGEGMVVKPINYITKGPKGMVQPAIKIRGREYLRIIYGAEYTTPENMERLKSRGLSSKRSLAMREFALGLEGVTRFVDKQPLRNVHQCAFGVLALESEPVDPRL